MDVRGGVFEKIIPDSGSSFKVLSFSEKHLCSNPHWHFHPEYEIAYISNGRGKRQIGNHVSFFEDGDLLLIGPYLPHYRFGVGGSKSYTTVGVQMSQSFMDKNIFDIPELNAFSKLKRIAPYGVSYSKEVKEEVGQLLLQMTKSIGFQRFQLLLSVLNLLSTTESYQLLNLYATHCSVSAGESHRIKAVYQLVGKCYKKKIRIEEVADALSLSIPYTCRFLKEKLFKTFSEILNEYRVSVATELLIDTDKNVLEICYEVGYNNISHFNRRFKKVTGVSPKEFRRMYIDTKMAEPILL